MRDHDSLRTHQRKIYLRILEDIAAFKNQEKRETLRYQEIFEKQFSRKILNSSRNELFSKISQSSIILCGDFHTFRQSQKVFCSIAVEMKKLGLDPAISLECIQIKHQKHIESYLSGLITLDELRDQIDFNQNWPFPWENYCQIFNLAKKHRWKIYGLNSPANNLKMRDIKAAKIIAALEKKHSQNLVLFGELHLANNHLPFQINKINPKSAITILHQNIPKIFWRTYKKQNQIPEVVKISKREFCIQSSVPWTKFKSYLDWLEGNANLSSQDIEISDEVFYYADAILGILKLKVRANQKIPITAQNDFYRLSKSKIKKDDLPFFKYSQKSGRVTYLPIANTILIPEPSSNSIFEAASLLIWLSQHDSQKRSSNKMNPLFTFMIGYLGSKFLNPKRKCNEIGDITYLYKKTKKEFYLMSLKILQPYFHREIALPSKIKNTNNLESNKNAAYILGDRLYISSLRNKKNLTFIRDLFSVDPFSKELILRKLCKIPKILDGIQVFKKLDKF